MLKKCEILSICRKIRLFEDVFYFFLALSLYFLLVFPLAFDGKESKKTRAMLLHIALGGMKRGFLFSFFFSIFRFFVQADFFCPFGMIEGVPEHGKI